MHEIAIKVREREDKETICEKSFPSLSLRCESPASLQNTLTTTSIIC